MLTITVNVVLINVMKIVGRETMLTAQELCERASTMGLPLDVATLGYLSRIRFLRPIRTSRGRGRGVVGFYPAASLHKLQELTGWLEEGHSIASATRQIAQLEKQRAGGSAPSRSGAQAPASLLLRRFFSVYGDSIYAALDTSAAAIYDGPDGADLRPAFVRILHVALTRHIAARLARPKEDEDLLSVLDSKLDAACDELKQVARGVAARRARKPVVSRVGHVVYGDSRRAR